jgi:ABC-type transport system involved in multi-copper enzyme maturation permease subunit
MISSWFMLVLGGILICLLQVLAALPWLIVILRTDWTTLKKYLLPLAGGVVGAGLVVGIILGIVQDSELLAGVGRWYGFLLQFQLILDFFVAVFTVMIWLWPRGGAVALAAFREWLRHPLFWFITAAATILIGLVSPSIPYFTFGEDTKMIKELGYDTIMLGAVAFGVVAAAMSISEEIEGRTAITLMSKPISRRQFLLGKFSGILLAGMLMTGVLSLVFSLVLWYKHLHPDEYFMTFAPSEWVEQATQIGLPLGEGPANLLRGALWWADESAEIFPGLVLGFCQSMVLLAIAVALATRLPMILNLVICLVIFFLSHLAPVLQQVSQGKFALVRFMAELMNYVLPALGDFKVSNAIVLPTPPPPQEFAIYVASVTLYAVIYTVSALLVGLILFEDRDLA